MLIELSDDFGRPVHVVATHVRFFYPAADGGTTIILGPGLEVRVADHHYDVRAAVEDALDPEAADVAD